MFLLYNSEVKFNSQFPFTAERNVPLLLNIGFYTFYCCFAKADVVHLHVTRSVVFKATFKSTIGLVVT